MARKVVKPDHVRVRVLGATDLQIGSRRIGMNTEGLFAFALYLSTRAGERIPRDEVLEVFWTEGPEESRRHAMRQMLYRLRQKGVEFDEEGEFLRLGASRVASDLNDCLKADWPERASASDVEAALTLGPTFSTRLAAPFLEWFDGVRSSVAAQHRKAAQKQIVQARKEGRWADLDRWALAVLKTDPLNEEATLARAESAAMAGSKVMALEILDTYLAEIGQVAPELGKPALVLRKRIAEKRADWSQKGPREVRLVGRTTEAAQLIACVEACASGRSSSLQLTGGSGLGKSRLLQEAREFAALRGLAVLNVSCEPLMIEHPYALVRDLVRQLLDRPGAAGTPPRCMELLRLLVADDTDTIGPQFSSSPHLDGRVLTRSLIDILAAVSAETRLIVCVDDLHHADAQSVSVVTATATALRNTRCGFLLAAQASAAIVARPSDQTVDIPLLRVSALATGASRELAAATIAAHDIQAPEGALEAVVIEAGGNPLFVRELALSRARSLNGASVPESLARIVQSRMSSLDELSLRLLRLTALLGDAATTTRLRRLTQGSAAEYVRALEELENDAVVTLDDEKILRVHDFWRNATISGLPAAAGAALALECAECLMSDDASSSPRLQRRAAYLFRQAGDHARALELSLASIDSLQRAGLVAEALIALEALDALSRDKRDRARILARKSRAMLTLGQPDRALDLAVDAQAGRWLQQEGTWADHLLAVEVSAECHLKLDLAAVAPMTELLSLSQEPGLSQTLRQRACVLGVRIASNTADIELVRTFAATSRLVNENARTTPQSWMTDLIFQAELGTVQGTLETLATLESLDLDQLAVADRCLLLRFASHAHRIAGECERALSTGRSAYSLALENDLQHQARVAAELLAFICLDYSQLSDARGWIEASEDLSQHVRYGTSLLSLDHARDRLATQEGQFELVARRIVTRLDAARLCGTVHGRAGELGLAAYSLAMVKPSEIAFQLTKETTSALAKLKGRWSGDFPTEVACKALVALGQHDEARALASNHVINHRAREKPVLGSFFEHLASALSQLT